MVDSNAKPEIISDPDVSIQAGQYGVSVDIQQRQYPCSADENGLAISTAIRKVKFSGPFGPLVAVIVDNRSAVADVILYGDGVTHGNRIGAGKIRRLEFYTPTYPGTDVRVSTLSWDVVATADDAVARVFIEVE